MAGKNQTKQTLKELRESSEQIVAIPSPVADALAADKLVRRVTIDPPAPNGQTAVRLTSLGRASAAVEPEIESSTSE